MTTTETNKALVRRFYQAVDQGDTSVVETLFSTEWVNVDPSMPPMSGWEGAHALIHMLKTGFPDFTSQIELIAAEGNRVAVHTSHAGTHRGTFLGIMATGKHVAIKATGIFTVKDSKLIENRVVFDAFGLLQQLGVAP
jgi:steroid delta-isomerase-like uncharacterized protein